MTSNAKSRKQKFSKWISSLGKVSEVQVVNAIFTISPWLSPVITSWMVFDATQLHLGWSWQKALVSAIIVEVNGIASTNLVLYLHRAKADKFSLTVGWGIIGIYIGTILFLTMFLDTYSVTHPELAKFSSPLFVALVLSSYATVALRTHVRVTKIEQRANKPVRGNKAGTHPVSPSLSVPVTSIVTPVTVAEKVTAKERLIHLFTTEPVTRDWSSEQIAERVGCSSSNVRKLAHSNGNGWEVK